jgi:hypothetical protein
MDDFVTQGEALLALAPSSAEEIGRAGREARALVARLGEVARVSAAADTLFVFSRMSRCLQHLKVRTKGTGKLTILGLITQLLHIFSRVFCKPCFTVD